MIIRKSMRSVRDFLLATILFASSSVYHGLLFLLVMFITCAMGRLIASVVYSRIQVHWLSPFYFDGLVIITIFPYLLHDLVIPMENCSRKLLRRYFPRIPRGIVGQRDIMQMCFTMLLMGASFGLVICASKQRIYSNNHAGLPSPLASLVETAGGVLISRNWTIVTEMLTPGNMHTDTHSPYSLEFLFLLCTLFPLYATIRCLNSSGSADSSNSTADMRLHLWHFLWSGVSQCWDGEQDENNWSLSQCQKYLITFILEIIESTFFILLPLTVMYLSCQNLMDICWYSKCTILYCIVASGTLLILEEAIFARRMKLVLQSNLPARQLASCFLLYLASFPIFVVFFKNQGGLGRNRFLEKNDEIFLSATCVAYCAYGLCKITLNDLWSMYVFKHTCCDRKKGRTLIFLGKAPRSMPKYLYSKLPAKSEVSGTDGSSTEEDEDDLLLSP